MTELRCQPSAGVVGWRSPRLCQFLPTRRADVFAGPMGSAVISVRSAGEVSGMPLDEAFGMAAGLATAAALAIAGSMLYRMPLRMPRRATSVVALLVLAAACYALSRTGLHYHDLGGRLGAPDRLLTDLVTMTALFAVLALLLLLGQPWAEAWPRIGHRLAALTTCAAGMALCAAGAGNAGAVYPDAGNAGASTAGTAGNGNPEMLVYFTLYVAFMGTALIEIFVLSWHHARFTWHGPLRHVGLLITCAGAVAGGAALAGQITWAVVNAPHLLPPALPATRSCADLIAPPQCAFTVALPGASVLLPTAGVTLPVLGGAVTAAWRFWQQVRMLIALGPLWERMRNTFPQISLPEHGTRVRLDPAFRLYRRVIEIGDGRTLLRPYMRPEVSAVAAAAATRIGLRGDELRATVEAARIVAALRARHIADRCDPEGCDPPPPDHAEAEVPDLPAEAAWLAKVARAYATSPIVYRLMTHRQ
ncbi:MAG: hypothetical protein J2P25_13495 [Nocardiopsaceae bacterium]|nr:hypothetical protein [Nocardiopsaceae bacterium]